MDENTINQLINKYIKDNLSPKQEQRDYITQKYAELRSFLSGNCFQAGSYARYTATDPVHDLDTIHPSADITIKDDPSVVIDSLYAVLEEAYSNSKITKIKNISRQTHSVTIEFADAPEEFSIDIVPAIELPSDLNEYGDPLYLVPEILRLNKHNRQRRYEMAEKEPIGWIKSDPRGYIHAASDLNESNSNFRHTAKLIKKWRHECKVIYGDNFCLKSFHLEQIVYEYFIENPETSTLNAIISCFAVVSDSLREPRFADRANPDRFIDEYVSSLTTQQRQLILRLQAEAYTVVRKLPSAQSEEDVKSLLKELCSIHKQVSPTFVPPTRTVTPRQPWATYEK